MIEELLKQNEGKTLEFKENANSLERIVCAAVAFANTAGGIILIGVRDRTRELVGLKDPLLEEGRIANALAHLIEPLLIPDMEIVSYHNKELLLIRVAHQGGPFFIKKLGKEKGAYVRLGSTNRLADTETLQALTLLSRNVSFDELPCLEAEEDDIDWEGAEELFKRVKKRLTRANAEDLGIIISKLQAYHPTNGGILLFGFNRLKYFPDAIVRCARFAGIERESIIDELEISDLLPLIIDPVIAFIERNTRIRIEVGRIEHKKVPQYPPKAIREAIINALLHADYAMKGTTITIGIFDDRIEFTNPGGLTFGLTLEHALEGSSSLRNRTVGRIFKELRLIERWGLGLRNMIAQCTKMGLPRPKFEELHNRFRVTIYGLPAEKIRFEPWQELLIKYLKKKEKVTPTEAAQIWKLTVRTARIRLKVLTEAGIIKRIASSAKDPTAFYILSEGVGNPGE